jgi:iron only hydrogenase large subunit-like protein
MKNEKYFHSIKIFKDKCLGCTHCMRTCPTEAIRIRDGVAIIQDLKCIDCGECVRVCPHNANEAVSDDFEIILNYDYRILILPSSFESIDFMGIKYEAVIERIFALGFHEIWEEGIGNELYLSMTKKLIKENKIRKPIIGTACPSVVRLLQVNFPSLLENLSTINAPKDILAKLIRSERKSIKSLGIFYLSPCPAKVTSIKNPQGIENSPFDGALSTKSLYKKILSKKETKKGKVFYSGKIGLAMGKIGGEKISLKASKMLEIDGIGKVKDFFEKLEEEKTPFLDFIEAWACYNGCVGGTLLPANDIFIGSYQLEVAEKKRKKLHSADPNLKDKQTSFDKEIINLETPISPRPQYFLAEDLTLAAEIAKKIKFIYEKLPKIDCGSCGAPSCYAFAEDVAKGEANLNNCIFFSGIKKK